MKKSILLFILVSLFTCAFAVKPVVSVNDAKQTAANFLTEQCHINAESIQLTLQYTETDENGEPLFYRFQLNNRGFVIVSASEYYYPVLAFSYETDFELSEESDAFCESYKKNIQEVKSAKTVDAGVAKAWNHFNCKNFSKAKDGEEVGECQPLLTTNWGQTIYYNQYCPYDVHAKSEKDFRTTTGVVAVAMASILNYYRYPTQATGGVSYIPALWSTYLETYPRIYVNLNEITYNYDAMASTIGNYNGEVAKLLFHTGATALTQYSAERTKDVKTKTDPSEAFNAMKQYWGYSNDAQQSFTEMDHIDDGLSNEPWIIENVLPELDARRPVFYSAYKEMTKKTHLCFVIDGYKYLNNKVFLHVNWMPTVTDNEMKKAYYMYASNNWSYKYSESIFKNMQPDALNIEKPVTSETELTAKSGTICDGAGNMKYASMSDRKWVIAAPNATSYTFTFKRLNTEADNDVISIYSGDEPIATNLERSFSGQYLTVAADSDRTEGSQQQVTFDMPSLPASFTVNASTVLVTFTSNDSIEDYGFVLEYTSTYDQSGISSCSASQDVVYPHYVITDDPFVSAGSLQPFTPEFENFVSEIKSDEEAYRALNTCSWTIKQNPQDNSYTTLGYYFKFPKFDLKAGDFVEITTVGASPELLYVFDVFNWPQSSGYTVNNNRIKVRFVTDHWMEGEGFEMEYWALMGDKINQESGISELSVYPNPATNFLNVNLTADAQNIGVNVLDMSGKVLYNDMIDHNGGNEIYKVPVSNLASGIYFLQLNTQTGKSVQKFIVR